MPSPASLQASPEFPVQPSLPGSDLSLFEMATPLAQRWMLLLLTSLAAGAVALGLTYLITPIFTARTSILPPQQQQSAAASALASLGGLAGLAGGLARTPADQYVALMQSVTVTDRLIDKFKLIQAYDKKLRVDARAELDKRVRMVVGKKDGLITIEVEDEDPARAAQMADQFVAELRTLTSTLSVTEAQQRRAFFERELKRARDGLTQAQTVLQASGFSQGALKAEPKIAADNYARLRAQVVAAQVRLQTLQSQLADKSPEVREQQSLLQALQTELARSERATDQAGGPDYVSKYREFKYQETLFELFARQYEVARVDESREGALIQVVDPATVPEKKSRPKRLLLAASAGLLALLLMAGVLVVRHVRRLRRGDVPVPAGVVA
jgi:uncharacterized protein involved in exopolysaccharide biosynthesis